MPSDGRIESSIGIKAHGRNIREKLRTFNYTNSTTPDSTLDAGAAALSTQVEAVLAGLAAMKVQPVGSVGFSEIAD